MAVCPQCSTELQGDFGMVACSNCLAVSVIDLDGNVTLDSAVTTNLQSDTVEAGPADPQESHDVAEPNMPNMIDVPEIEYSEVTDALSVNQDISNDPSFADEGLVPSKQPSNVHPTSTNLSLNEFDQQLTDSEGPLAYDIIIEGIDTREMRIQLTDCLSDSRLRLDVDKLIQKIRHGKLQIDKVSAVKAIVLISHLKASPFEIRWVQHTIYE